ncbi:MFS family permease [Bradyrhizobium sp. AZCC 1588]|uniref:MFS transporter n=2 Tax=unclassified Bradyrhizobium TaxID=2631580 RepID=UPI002FF2F023
MTYELEPFRPGPQSSVNMPLLVLARACTTAVFMTYPACLSWLMDAWQMTATRAGLVQGAFTASFAVSLLVVSFLCDRFGAKTVFTWAAISCAASALFFATFARSFESALVCMALLGLAQGATYTPAIMLVSTNAPPDRKASAVGWVLAGMSAGYVLSIVLANAMLATADYRLAFAVTAGVAVVGSALSIAATWNARDQVVQIDPGKTSSDSPWKRQARLLTLGYIGHTWELLGAWAWIPAFLTASLLSQGRMTGVEIGLWIAVTLHVSGFFGSFLSGYAADRFGAKPVLVGFALVGAACSLVVGWLNELNVALLLAVVGVYGFAIIGDSSVLSSAMTDAVPASQLGRALGLRSILGVGAGSVSPIVFGMALDMTPASVSWGLAFCTLAFGGALAFACAIALRR